MKIGVVTIWYGDGNYGMIWQCWALQKYLKMMGHDPYVVRFIPLGSWLKRLASYFLLHYRIIKDNEIRQHNKNKKRNKAVNKQRRFEEFRNKYISFSPQKYYTIEKLKLFPPKADCYICGSDQIWMGSVRKFNSRAYYLDFGPSSVRRVAYAPSFGLKTYPQRNLRILQNLLSRIDWLSCREYDGVLICKQANVEAQKVEDPTLLLSSKDYAELCCPVKYNNYVYIYSLNVEKSDDLYFRELNEFFDNKHCVVTPADGYFPGVELFGKDVIYEYATPEMWLSLIANANLIVTSSFHGVVFSIIFNRRFAFVPLKGKLAEKNNRVLDLLNRLEMNFAIVTKGEDYAELIKLDYGWNTVNSRINDILRDSKLFLKNALS